MVVVFLTSFCAWPKNKANSEAEQTIVSENGGIRCMSSTIAGRNMVVRSVIVFLSLSVKRDLRGGDDGGISV